jgi:MFS family permease
MIFVQNQNTQLTSAPKISLATMLILGAGWFASNFFWGFYSGSMPLFLNKYTQSKFLISLILGSAGLASCVVPPVVGYFSDRASRFGRRKPFVVAGGLGVMLCLAALPHLKIYGTVAALSVVLYLCIAMAETPLYALLPDLTPVEQRSTVSGVVHLLGSFGLIVFFILSSLIWDAYPTAVFRMVAFVTFGAMMVVVVLIKEPGRSEALPRRSLKLGEYLSSIGRETQAMRYFAVQFFVWMGFYLIASFLPLFIVEELGATEGDSYYVPMALTVVSTLAMVPMGMLGDRAGRKRILSVMLAFWAVVGLGIGFCSNLSQTIIAVGLTGLPFATILGVGYAYMLDLIPRERTAEFVGFSIFSISLPMVLGTVLAGKLIDLFGFRSLFPIASLMMFIGLVILQFTRPRTEN